MGRGEGDGVGWEVVGCRGVVVGGVIRLSF